MKRKVHSKKYTRVCKRFLPVCLPSIPLLQRPSRMLLLIRGYVASAWGRAQGTPHRGTNSSQGWESGVNTSSLTDGPLHYINTQHRDRERERESPGRNKDWSSINSTNKYFVYLYRQNRFFPENMTAARTQESQESAKVYHVPLDV